MTDQELQDLRQWAAEKVMGWIQGDTYWWLMPGKVPQEYISKVRQSDWTPDTDLDQAFMVVEKMFNLGWDFKLVTTFHGHAKFYCEFWSDAKGDAREATTYDDNPALAILLAARKAVEGSDG